MKLSILVATLGASQISSVVGSKQEREQLRRNLRQNERKAQFMFSATDTEDAENYDDFFGYPEEVADIGVKEEDDFFDASGFDYDWGAQAEDEPNTDVFVPASYTVASEEKSFKGGKAMWEEVPYTGKAAKSGKSSKKSRSSVKKGAKGALLGLPTPHTYDAVVEDAVVEETVTTDSWLSAFEGQGGQTYSDIFKAEEEEAADETEETEVMGRMGGRMDTYDDDYFNPTEQILFLPRPTVTVGGSLFSVNPQTMVTPVVPDGSGNTLTLGTEYLFNEVTLNAQDIDSKISPIDVDNEQVLFVVSLDGFCDRIGPADQNSVQGYCFFTYTFIDPATSLTAGSFAAQGIIVNAQVPGQLTVTGGTGILTGASGLVEILPAAVDQNVSPPELIQPAAGLDPFNEIAGWAHFFEFDVDVLFFLPELYGDRR